MYAATAATAAILPGISSFFTVHRRSSISRQTLALNSLRRRSRRSRRSRRLNPFRKNPDPNPKPSDERDFNLSVDLQDIADRASSAVTGAARSSEAQLRRFLTSGADAVKDLATSVSVEDRRVVSFSCRRSSILFVGDALVWSVIAVVTVRVLMWLRSDIGFGDEVGVRVQRRDRSLGGREVVVGMKRRREEDKKGGSVLRSPLSDVREIEMRVEGVRAAKKEERLPEWWVEAGKVGEGVVGDGESKWEADRLVRAIVDKRMSGMDYKDDDIIQLRHLCRFSGVKVSFGTDNARDSFYRASVNFVLSVCSRVTQPAGTVQIDGEKPTKFISGLADNIGLESIRAARIICAAVAARTGSCFLQAWALEVHGKRSEVLEEMSKICLIFEIFPPEEYSPEMEMVASGLKKTLQVEQRKHLLTLFMEACSSKCKRTAEDALGLIYHDGHEGSDVRLLYGKIHQ